MKVRIKTAGLYDTLNKQRLDKDAWPGTINLPEFIEVEVESTIETTGVKNCIFPTAIDCFVGNTYCPRHSKTPKITGLTEEISELGYKPKEHSKEFPCCYVKEVQLPEKLEWKYVGYESTVGFTTKINEIITYLESLK